MTKKPKRPRDINQLAKYIVDLATGERTEEKSKKKKAQAKKPAPLKKK